VKGWWLVFSAGEEGCVVTGLTGRRCGFGLFEEG
jgi:hypothetical protein